MEISGICKTHFVVRLLELLCQELPVLEVGPKSKEEEEQVLVPSLHINEVKGLLNVGILLERSQSGHGSFDHTGCRSLGVESAEFVPLGLTAVAGGNFVNNILQVGRDARVFAGLEEVVEAVPEFFYDTAKVVR